MLLYGFRRWLGRLHFATAGTNKEVVPLRYRATKHRISVGNSGTVGKPPCDLDLHSDAGQHWRGVEALDPVPKKSCS